MKTFLYKNIYKKRFVEQHKKFFLWWSMNMTNPQQNKIHNEIEQSNKDINLLQDKLKNIKNEEELI